MSVNFTPNKNEYSNLGSFRFWCQKVLPLVYDDSLSYYELLCKVVNYLNETISNVELMGEDMQKLYSAYEELQGYVNGYFDNLDAQEMINNKLNEMSKDGSLSALIQPLFDSYKSLIDETVNKQNNDIDVLKARMNSYTSMGEGGTTGDAELTDGRVDYKGNIHPNIGGHIRSVTGEIGSKIDKLFVSNNKFTGCEVVYGALFSYQEFSGDTYSAYNYFKEIPVKGGTTYKFSSTVRKVALLDTNKEVVQHYDNLTEYTAESDGYVNVTMLNSSFNDSMYMVESGIAENIMGYGVYLIDENIKAQGLSERAYADVDSALLTDAPVFKPDKSEFGYLYSSADGQVYYMESYKTSAFIKMEKGATYKITPKVRNVLLYDKNNVAIEESYVSSTVNNYEYTATYDGYLRFTYYVEDENIISFTISKPITKRIRNGVGLSNEMENEVNDKIRNATGGYLHDLTFVNFGDSIAENRSESKSYATQFNEKYGGTLYDYAVGGATVSRIEGQGMSCILTQVETYLSENEGVKTNFVLINGGANDYSQKREVGTVFKTSNHYTTSDYSASFDETTYLGALETCFKKLREKYVDTVIVFVIPHKHGRLDDKWEQMLAGAREVCCKWSVALLDMDKDGQLNTRLPQMRVYSDEGGTHQNTLGNAKFYVPQLINLLEKYLR